MTLIKSNGGIYSVCTQPFQKGALPILSAKAGYGLIVFWGPRHKPSNPLAGFTMQSLLQGPLFRERPRWRLGGTTGFMPFLRKTGLAWVLACMGGLLTAPNPRMAQAFALSASWAGWKDVWVLRGRRRWARRKAFEWTAVEKQTRGGQWAWPRLGFALTARERSHTLLGCAGAIRLDRLRPGTDCAKWADANGVTP
jgi:hypothetical protein